MSSGETYVGCRWGWDAASAAARRLRSIDIARDAQQPCGTGREGQSVQLAIERDRLEMQVDEDAVERVLDDARVAPGRTGTDLVPLEQEHPATGGGEMVRGGDPDDPAADDDDIRGGLWSVTHPRMMPVAGASPWARARDQLPGDRCSRNDRLRSATACTIPARVMTVTERADARPLSPNDPRLEPWRAFLRPTPGSRGGSTRSSAPSTTCRWRSTTRC